MLKPKILFVDVETAPLLGYCWSIWEQNIALNQLKSDWHLLSWAAKWRGESKMLYMDQRKAKNIEDDREILKGIWKLLDEADIVIGQNAKAFDVKKLNARFILNDMQPPSSYKVIDTMLLAKKHFSFTSNKLEFLSDKLCVKFKKLKHTKFVGFELWKECIAGNESAWNEMKKYNKHDVLALEELYGRLIPWDNTVNLNVYNDSQDTICTCGSNKFRLNGYFYSSVGKFQRYRCSDCGSEIKGRQNLLSKDKKSSLKTGTIR